MILWSLPIFVIVGFALRDRSQFCESEWLMAIPLVAMILGTWLVYTATRTNDEVFERRIDFLADGGDWAGLIFVLIVLIVAVPIYEIYRLLRNEPRR